LLCISGYKLDSIQKIGIEGWTIFIDQNNNGILNSGEQSTTTGADGNYSFCDLVPGTYNVSEVMQPDWQPVGSTYHIVDLKSGCSNVDNQNFTNERKPKTYCISGYKLDATEKIGIKDWTIFIDQNNDGKLNPGESSTLTDADGKYLFCGLSVGEYNVSEVMQPNWKPVGSTYIKVDLKSDIEDQNFTNKRAPTYNCLSGYKYQHETGRGLQGWQIKVTNISDSSGWSVTTETDASGLWQVCGLTEGSYNVSEVMQPGWIPLGPTYYIVTLPDQTEGIDFINDPTAPPITVTKTAALSAVHLGEENTYTITVCNNLNVPLNVVIKDVISNDKVQISKLSEQPSSDGQWHKTLQPGDCWSVTYTAVVPVTEMQYDMSQGVSGQGFVNVYTNYDTTFQPFTLKNCAYASADGVGTVSSCADVNVIGELGTALKKKEFGTGQYDSEELTQVKTENKSIVTGTSLKASYMPSSFSLPGGRSIDFQTKWTEKSQGKNFVTGASMSEEYTHATKIEKDRTISMDKNGSTMKTEVEFNGTGHIGVLKKESPDAIPKVKPIYESTENYVGAFNITENVDEYGSSVKSEKSTTGTGFAAVDKRVRDSQRTYEYGTGSYNSEEIIDTASNYIAKDINLTHAPAGAYDYSPSFKAAPDIKWKEGMWSRSGSMGGGILLMDNNTIPTQATASGCSANGTPTASLISEEYNSLDYLKKSTVASGLNEMKTEASFSGMADYKTIAKGANKGSELVDEERYVGTYDIKRNVVLGGVARYDHPHLVVTKTGSTKTEWYNHRNATIAQYTITVTNDGNRALAPVIVRDLLPPGTQYIGSSNRPTQISDDMVNWTLTTLGIGNTATITLRLNVTSEAQGKNLINRVQVCAPVDDEYVCASNISALEFNWLACCPPEVRIFKNVRLDATDPTLVHYEIIVENHASDTVAAKVTDELPAGLTLINASRTPAAASGSQMLVWNILDLSPGASKTIDYTARAVRDGGYTNRVHVEAWDVKGKAYDTNDASAYIVVSTTGVAPRTTRYGGWQPPAEFNMSASTEGLTLDEFAGPSYSEMEY
jgi:uncharacterized repeat protein (TIGR01451 family)